VQNRGEVMLHTLSSLRLLAITAILTLASGCATTYDIPVVKQTVERLKYFTNPQGEQQVEELIVYYPAQN
jgi:hypothetical protein